MQGDGTATTGTVTVDQIEQPVNVQTSEETSLNVQTSEGTVLNVDEIRQETVFETTEGTIHLLHEMTLGDVVISMFLMFILVFLILDRFIRR